MSPLAGRIPTEGVGFQIQSYYDERKSLTLIEEGHCTAVALLGLAASEIARLEAELAAYDEVRGWFWYPHVGPHQQTDRCLRDPECEPLYRKVKS